jgi:hypothetical protein
MNEAATTNAAPTTIPTLRNTHETVSTRTRIGTATASANATTTLGKSLGLGAPTADELPPPILGSGYFDRLSSRVREALHRTK